MSQGRGLQRIYSIAMLDLEMLGVLYSWTPFDRYTLCVYSRYFRVGFVENEMKGVLA